MAGKTFGRLTCIDVLDESSPSGHRLGLFDCACGKRVKRKLSRVKSGATQSCGCLVGRRPIHGMKGSPEYRSWRAMKDRCLNPQSKDYPRWGGRGVRVCDRWARSFRAFCEDVGPRPPGTTLDRIDSAGHYEPGNVRWATPSEQVRNSSAVRPVMVKGVFYETSQDAANAHGVSLTTIKRWCCGSVDQRRAHHRNGGRTPPRPDCYLVTA